MKTEEGNYGPAAECLFGFRCVALLYFHIAMQQDAGMPIRITIC